MPVIVQVGKQRVPQGLPLPISFYAIGESQRALSRLRESPIRLRSLSNEELVTGEVLHEDDSAFVYDDSGGVSWWSLVDTRRVPTGLYTTVLETESLLLTHPISAVLDEESFKKLLTEENDEEFDESLPVPTDFDELGAVARQVIATHPAISSFRAASLLRGVAEAAGRAPIIFSSWSNHGRRIGTIPEACLRYAVEAFLSDLLYFAPFPSSLFGFYGRSQPLFDCQAGFVITEQDDLAIFGRVSVPFRLPSIFDSVRTQADIVFLERFHPRLFRAAIDIKGEGGLINLELRISVR